LLDGLDFLLELSGLSDDLPGADRLRRVPKIVNIKINYRFELLIKYYAFMLFMYLNELDSERYKTWKHDCCLQYSFQQPA